MLEWLVVFHLLGIIFWVGTLLILTRVLAWHAAQPTPPTDLSVLERKLFFGGALAGVVITLVTGVWMLATLEWGPLDAKMVGGGFHIKLTFVFLLLVLTVVLKGKMDALAGNGEKPSAGTFKMLHGMVALLLLLTLITFFVIRPAMAEKKAKQRAEQVDTQSLLLPVVGD